AICGAVAGLPLHAFKPDLSEQPATHPPLTPADGEMVALNPPPMIWRVDDRAASYTVEFSQDARFRGKTIRVPGIDLPFYNHSEELREGTWFWRYYVVAKDGEVSEPSPGKSFVVTKESTPFAVPAMKDL